MNRKKNVDAEIQAFIENGKCDVLLSGTPEHLLSAICSVIKALSIRLCEEEEVLELQEEADMPEDMTQSYVTALLMSEILEALSNIDPLITHFELTDNDELNTLLKTCYGQLENCDNIEPEKIVSDAIECELDFNAFSTDKKESTDNNE